jgi:hypothetical protein
MFDTFAQAISSTRPNAEDTDEGNDVVPRQRNLHRAGWHHHSRRTLLHGQVRAQPARPYPQRGLGSLRLHALQAANQFQLLRLRHSQQIAAIVHRCVHGEGNPATAGKALQSRKCRVRDPHHLERVAAEVYRFPHQIWIPAELVFPRVVADHHDGPGARRARIPGQQRAAFRHSGAQHRKIIPGNQLSKQCAALHFGHHALCGNHFREGALPSRHILVLRPRETVPLPILPVP